MEIAAQSLQGEPAAVLNPYPVNQWRVSRRPAQTSAQQRWSGWRSLRRNTRGLLRRRAVHAAFVELIGKESNRIEEVEHAEIHDPGEVLER